MKENATTSLGNPSEEIRQLQSSPALAQERVLMPCHLLHIRRLQQTLPRLHSAWILGDSKRNAASQQAFVKSLSQLSRHKTATMQLALPSYRLQHYSLPRTSAAPHFCSHHSPDFF